MNKKFLFLAALAVSALGASAQLTVVENQIRVGELQGIDLGVGGGGGFIGGDIPPVNGINGFRPGDNLQVQTEISLDTAANLCILGKYKKNSGGLITFGDNRNAYIGERGTEDSNQLMLGGTKGLRYLGANGEIMFNHAGTFDHDFYFLTGVSAVSFNTTSDARLKKDIASLDDSFAGLSGLNPVSYRMASVASFDEEGKSVLVPSSDDRLRYGFVAQEVKEIFPELVTESPEGYMSIDYIGFIPMLVKEIQDLRAQVQTLTEDEQEMPQKSKARAGVEGPAEVKATLSQNKPNPFSASTRIECTLPETVGSAYLCVYDLQGKQLKKITVEGRGTTGVTIDGSELAAGMYIYALIADGMEIDSKRMILTD